MRTIETDRGTEVRLSGEEFIYMLEHHLGHPVSGFVITNPDPSPTGKIMRQAIVNPIDKEHFVGNIIKENRIVPDAFMQIKELSTEFTKLGPFGEGNPEPILISQNTPLTKSNGKYLFLERPELKVIYIPEQHIYSDRVFVDILYSIDEYLDVSILKIDYPE